MTELRHRHKQDQRGPEQPQPPARHRAAPRKAGHQDGMCSTHGEPTTARLPDEIPASPERSEPETKKRSHLLRHVLPPFDSVLVPAAPLWAEEVEILTASVCSASALPPKRHEATHMPSANGCNSRPPWGALPFTQKTS